MRRFGLFCPSSPLLRRGLWSNTNARLQAAAAAASTTSSADPEAVKLERQRRKELKQQKKQKSKEAAAGKANSNDSGKKKKKSNSQLQGSSPTEGTVAMQATSSKAAANHFGSTMAPRTVVTDNCYLSFNETLTGKEVRSEFSAIPDGERDVTRRVKVAGRVMSVRDMGKVIFISINSDGTTLQVAANVTETFTKERLTEMKSTIRAGDIVGFSGNPGRSKRGEVTVFADDYNVLAPYVCADITSCPDQHGHQVIMDQDVKYRYRFIDMLNNPDTVNTFRMRHNIIAALRNFLNDLNFTEVETPIFNTVASGASARPFTTHHNALNHDLHLRVAPELYLKQCVVGGMERVFEIGKVFRNEDCDRSHNPEFTSCELYMAYKTYNDLMPLTEHMLQRLVMASHGKTEIPTIHPKTGETVMIDFAKPFRRVSVLDEIQRVSGVQLPPAYDLESDRGIATMKALLVRERVPIPQPPTASKLFDKLIDHFITDHVTQPTFVMDHPTFMSPLAKSHETQAGLTERFELFINGMEVCNAYSELNDPQEQLRRFEQQMKDREQGDDESMPLDETFLKALQVGLPPTAGWGMGIDRIVMILGGHNSIRDVILFPLLKPDDVSHDAKRRCKTAGSFGLNLPMTMFILSALEAELHKRGENVDHVNLIRQRLSELTKGEELLRSHLGKFTKGCDPSNPAAGPSLMCLVSCIACGGFFW